MEGHTEGSDDLSIDGTTDPVTVGLLVASRVDGCIVEPSELGEVGSVEGEFEEFIFDGAEVNCIVGVDDVRDASWFDWLVCVGYWHGHVLSNASA